MMMFLYSLTAFIVAVSILVTIHEYGHFWVARRLGVKVLRFSIGFGAPLVSWRGGKDATEYVIARIPLGGYVKMLDEREMDVAESELPRAFNRQPLLTRTAIVSAGPLFNFLFAVFAYWCMYMVGVTGLKPVVGQVEPGGIAQRAGLQRGDEILRIDGERTPTWETVTLRFLEKALANGQVTLVSSRGGIDVATHVIDLQDVSLILSEGNLLKNLGIAPFIPSPAPVIGRLDAGGAAERAGLMPGDRVISANKEQIDSWESWVKLIRTSPNRLINIEIERNDARMQLQLTPVSKADSETAGTIGYIGAAPDLSGFDPMQYRAVLQYPPVQAARQAVRKTWQVSALTVRMLAKMILGEASVENISGPIGIAKYAGYSAAIGLGQFLAFLGIVSISLGILNLLPVPVLDGGHLLFYGIEWMKGSPVSEQVQLIGQRVGIALLVMLMFLAFYNDLVKLLN